MKWIEGGVCAAKGFQAAGIHAGIRANTTKKDLSLIYSQKPCTCAGLFTKNKVKADPVLLDIEMVKTGNPQAVIANSGIANACAPNGMEHALEMQKIAAEALGVETEKVLVSSTGVIGMELHTEPIQDHIQELVDALRADSSGSEAAALGIMTTDTRKKEQAISFELSNHEVIIGGIAKGSGMIHPNMGTMLCYLTTDVSITKDLLREALLDVCNVTFNHISVDGDTSTNDSLICFANGEAGNPVICEKNEDYEIFKNALKEVCTELARKMARDGEGATHLITCEVKHAKSSHDAETLAKSVIGSSLTKAAIFGCDANWGRVLCALGYSGVDFEKNDVDIYFASKAGKIVVCKNGIGLKFDEDQAKKILSEEEVIIDVDMNEGEKSAVCWGCDLTYDYVKINGDYRT